MNTAPYRPAWLMIVLVLGYAGAAPSLTPAAAADSDAERFFENEVRPILVEHCGSCHGSEKQFGGLRLDSWHSISAGSDSAPIVIPHAPDESLLIQAVRREGGMEMPPDQPLTPAQVTTLVRWVEIGAPWPESIPIPEQQAAQQARAHWAFQPVVEPPLPSVAQTDWPRSPVDAFVLAELEARQLAPSPEADRRTLIRRASYVLTGLPPAHERIEQFVQSTDPQAYERLIEELLASPHYGQQWARHWLDIARYSDSKGYVYAREERFWTHAWSYRDWVVQALNADRPYNEFLLLQLAADQVATTRDDLAAMGFLTLGRRFLGVPHDIIDDRIDVVTRGMLGLTVSCARCHDHKFDPIPIKDYYSLYGVFASSAEREQSLCDPQELDAAYLAELQKRQQTLEDTRAEVRRETAERIRERVGDYLAAQFELEKYPAESFDQIFQKTDLLPTIVHRWETFLAQAQQRRDPVFAPWHRLVALADLPDDEFARQARAVCEQLQSADAAEVHPHVAAAFRTPPETLLQVTEIYGRLFSEVRQAAAAAQSAADSDHAPADPSIAALLAVLYGPESPCEIPDEPIVEIERQMDTGSCEKLWRLQSEVERWAIQSGQDRRARILVDRAVPIEPRVFRRGNPLLKDVQVPRHFLTLLSAGEPQPFTHGSGRLELAQKIIDPQNPLTARVLVNRVWGQYFGQPLVNSTSDFGLRAAPPSHPQLLDWLAARLVAEGWSLKELHRWIALSATFRQSDSGPQDASVRARAFETDPDNRWLWRFTPRRLSMEEMRDSLIAATGELDLTLGGKPVELWQPPFPKRRTLYGLVDRQFLPGVLRVFDFANPDLHTAQRADTTAPQQALFFLNHPLVLEQTRTLAAALADTATPAERVSELFQAVLRRAPTAAELADATEFIALAEAPAEETAAEPDTRTADWSYGYGAVAEEQGHTTGFTPLPYFDGHAWQGGPQFPDGPLGWVQLTAEGGHPGNDRAHAVIRRWTAPADLQLQIRTTLKHEPAAGDGIRAFILGSPQAPGIHASAQAHQQTVELHVDSLRVAAGQSVDFLVDIGDTLNSDQFLWSIQIVGVPVGAEASSPDQEIRWDAAANFSGPRSPQLTPWEQLAQVLLCTNEFLFVP